MPKKCKKRVCETIKLEVQACGDDNAERERVLFARLTAAVAEIVQGRYPNQPRTKFKKNTGGDGGP